MKIVFIFLLCCWSLCWKINVQRAIELLQVFLSFCLLFFFLGFLFILYFLQLLRLYIFHIVGRLNGRISIDLQSDRLPLFWFWPRSWLLFVIDSRNIRYLCAIILCFLWFCMPSDSLGALSFISSSRFLNLSIFIIIVCKIVFLISCLAKILWVN